MSAPQTPHDDASQHPVDAMEAIIPMVPIVLPIAGGVLIFLLAFIAIYMA